MVLLVDIDIDSDVVDGHWPVGVVNAHQTMSVLPHIRDKLCSSTY